MYFCLGLRLINFGAILITESGSDAFRGIPKHGFYIEKRNIIHKKNPEAEAQDKKHFAEENKLYYNFYFITEK